MSLTKAKLLAQVAEVRKQAAVFLTDTIYLLRRESETITNGESNINYSSPVAIPCRLINRSGASRTNVAAQFRATRQTFYDSSYRVQLPFGTDVKVTDHLLYDDIATGKQQRFEVTYVPPQHEFTGAFIIGAEEIE